jgi:hypothetical protein
MNVHFDTIFVDNTDIYTIAISIELFGKVYTLALSLSIL